MAVPPAPRMLNTSTGKPSDETKKFFWNAAPQRPRFTTSVALEIFWIRRKRFAGVLAAAGDVDLFLRADHEVGEWNYFLKLPET